MILTMLDQRIHFKGCEYFADQRKICVPQYGFLSRRQFNVIYGGRTFLIDRLNNTTRSAWNAALLIIPRK